MNKSVWISFFLLNTKEDILKNALLCCFTLYTNEVNGDQQLFGYPHSLKYLPSSSCVCVCVCVCVCLCVCVCVCVCVCLCVCVLGLHDSCKNVNHDFSPWELRSRFSYTILILFQTKFISTSDCLETT